MASGVRMDPHAHHAASLTLALGTTARVINLRNGQSAVVVIQDCGPHVKGRIIDLSPATAKQLGASPHSVIPVQVTPLKGPLSGHKGQAYPGQPAQAARQGLGG